MCEHVQSIWNFHLSNLLQHLLCIPIVIPSFLWGRVYHHARISYFKVLRRWEPCICLHQILRQREVSISLADETGDHDQLPLTLFLQYILPWFQPIASVLEVVWVIRGLILINPDVLLISVGYNWKHFRHIFTIIGGTISATIRQFLSPDFRGLRGISGSQCGIPDLFDIFFPPLHHVLPFMPIIVYPLCMTLVTISHEDKTSTRPS